MNRKELLTSLERARATERASAVAIRNVIGTFTWSGLAQEKREEVADALTALAAAAHHRADRLRQVIGRVQGGQKDVF